MLTGAERPGERPAPDALGVPSVGSPQPENGRPVGVPGGRTRAARTLGASETAATPPRGRERRPSASSLVSQPRYATAPRGSPSP